MRIHISSLPVYIPYVLFPLFFIVTRSMGYSFSRSWIDVVWILLGLFAAVWIAVTGRLLIDRRKFLFFSSAIALFAAIVTVKFGASLFEPVVLVPFIMELKPVLYLAVALLWVGAFGNIDPGQFRKAGVWLAALMVFDFLLESALAGEAIKPLGSGEINYDACLLLISFCTWFYGHESARSYIVIFIGILATLSRTALAAVVVISFFFGRAGLFKKMLIGAVCVLFILASFLVRDLPLDSLERMDRFWMWLAGLELISGDLLQSLIGFPSGQALPVNIPEELVWLWSSQQEGWGIEGVFPFHFHSFWLRFAITWGLVAVALAFIASAYIVFDRKKTLFLRTLVFLAVLEGLTMGVVYLSNVAVPLMLAVFSAVSAREGPQEAAGKTRI